MRKPIISIITLALILAASFILKATVDQPVSKQIEFAVSSFLWIGSLLLALLLINLAWKWRFSKKTAKTEPGIASWPNRRESYRIVYPVPLRPTLVVTMADARPVRGLEYPVLDLSEGGFSFLDDGSLLAKKSLSGQIRFRQGDTIKMSGRIVRNENSRISVQLRHAIDYSLILHQQRLVISSARPES